MLDQASYLYTRSFDEVRHSAPLKGEIIETTDGNRREGGVNGGKLNVTFTLSRLSWSRYLFKYKRAL